MRTETRFDVTVALPLGPTAFLFGPEGERAWAGPDWNPEFLHPQPAQDVDGAVFTQEYGDLSAVWVVARHDLEARHFRYVYFIAQMLVTIVDVRFEPQAEDLTRVHVVYARTALSPAGETQVRTMTEGDRRAGIEWQEAIDAYLSSKARG